MAPLRRFRPLRRAFRAIAAAKYAEYCDKKRTAPTAPDDG
jgi:hypothetical protein